MDPKDVQIAMLQRNIRVLASAMHHQSSQRQTQVAPTLVRSTTGFDSNPSVESVATNSSTPPSSDNHLKTLEFDQQSEPTSGTPAAEDLKRPKAAVVAWDLTHNPVGRAYVLYKLLEKDWDVELVGPKWERYGNDIWPPLKNAGLKIRSFNCETFSDFVPKAQLLAASSDYELVIVCKPRLPSIYLGALFREQCGCKTILDIDDHELSFFSDQRTATMSDLVSELDNASSFEQFEPYEEFGTSFSQSLIEDFDAVTVSNLALQDKFGGQIIRHARDENRFTPDSVSREQARDSLGIKQHEFAILFIGTPREHKGIYKVAEALESLNDERIVFHVIGTISDSRVADRLSSYRRANIVLHPDCNFSDLPFLLSAADLVPLLQDQDHPISQYQIPAKISDATALGIPVLATRTPPVVDLIASGLVHEVNDDNLLQTIVDCQSLNETHRSRLRNRFLSELSQSVNQCRLDLVLSEIRKKYGSTQSQISDGLSQLVTTVRSAYKKHRLQQLGLDSSDSSQSSAMSNVARRFTASLFGNKSTGPESVKKKDRRGITDEKLNFVFFWKQNDSGKYGRRSDMIVKFLSLSPRVGKIIQFDAPSSWNKIAPMAGATRHTDFDNNSANDSDLVRLHDRHLALLDTDTIRYRTYIKSQPITEETVCDQGSAPDSAYADYVRWEMSDFGLTPEATIAWFCPVIWDAPGLIDTLNFRGVVSDLIDDQRAWKNTPDQIEQLDNSYTATLARSNLVFANCQELSDSFALHGPVHVVPNGAERLSDFPATETPDSLDGLPGPVFGYIGTLRDRIDWILLEDIIPRFPDASFVFIGPGHDLPQARQLAELPNVHMLGPIAYEKLLPYLRGFDVGIIPHIRNRLTQKMNPLKLYNYFAAGLPIVTTDIDNMTDVVDQIHVAQSADEFIKALEVSSGESIDINSTQWRDAMQAIAWDSRVSDIVDLLESHFNAEDSGADQKVGVAC